MEFLYVAQNNGVVIVPVSSVHHMLL